MHPSAILIAEAVQKKGLTFQSYFEGHGTQLDSAVPRSVEHWPFILLRAPSTAKFAQDVEAFPKRFQTWYIRNVGQKPSKILETLGSEVKNLQIS